PTTRSRSSRCASSDKRAKRRQRDFSTLMGYARGYNNAPRTPPDRHPTGGLMKIVMWKRLSYALAAVALMAIAIAAKDVRTISIRDNCDQATFDAAIGPGTCVGEGDTTFQEFLDALADGGHEKWRFNNSVTEADVAANAKNEGGEGHTFTPVAKFGGGFIQDLNMGMD